MSIVGMRNFMQGKMQYVMLALAVVMAVGIVGIGIGSGRNQAAEDDSGGVLAKVNGEKIARKDFELRYLNESEQGEDTRLPSAYEESQARGKLFDGMVDQMLRLQAADKAGVKVRKGEVKKRINEYIDMRIGQLKEQVFANYKGKKTQQAFEEQLRKNTGMSLSQIKTDIRKSIDPEMVQQQLVIEKHVTKLREGVDSSDRAVRASFDEVWLAQITVNAAGRSMNQAEQRAKEILAKARAGEEFAKLASQYSEDALKSSGGDQGTFVRLSDLRPEIAGVLTNLKRGDFAGPISQPDSYVVLQVKDRRSALPSDYSDPKKRREYRDAYLQKQQSALLSKQEADMHKSAHIVVNDPELRAYLITKDIASYIGPDGGVRAKAKAKEALKELEKAIAASAGNSQALARCYSQNAYIYYVLGKTDLLSPTPTEKVEFRKKAITSVTEALKYTESNDLRLLLADLYVDDKNYDGALEQLAKVSEYEYYDYQTHAQILAKYKEMKSARPDVVPGRIAHEEKWIADYEKQMKEAEAAQKAQEADTTQQTTKPFKVNPGG